MISKPPRFWNRVWLARVLVSALVIAGAALITSGRAVAQDDGSDGFPVLGAGQTMTGIYVMSGTVAAAYRTVGYIDAQINFPRQVRDNARYQVEIIQRGQSVTKNCPGLRLAAAGFLCIYEVYKDARLTSLGGVYNPIGSGGKIDRDGAVLFGKVESADSDDGDSPFSAGGWAIKGLPPGSR
jgi:hypothetical protein